MNKKNQDEYITHGSVGYYRLRNKLPITLEQCTNAHLRGKNQLFHKTSANISKIDIKMSSIKNKSYLHVPLITQVPSISNVDKHATQDRRY